MNSFKTQILKKINIVYALVTLMMLSTIAIVSRFTTEFNIIILAWGALYIIYDFFKEKNFIKSRYSKYLIIYMILFLISNLININLNFVENMKTFGYTCLFIFVLYSYKKDQSAKTMQSELYNINTIVITISSIVAFASLITFIFLIQFTYNDIPQGFIYPNHPALWGFYSNPNSGGMVAAISMIVTFFNLYLCGNLHVKELSKLKKVYYYSNILLQWICLILSNSRGVLMALLAFVLFASYYLFTNLLAEKKKFNGFKSVIISLLLTLIIFSIFNLTVSVSKSGLSYIPKSVQKLINIEEEEDSNSLTLERNIVEGNITSGRFDIWKY
jgi:hypothetical protein